ncbi:MAG: AAA family ATPase [Acidobacteria bacterium]|nr:AAA family ATPase [Acidobacteriota bacterium]
MRPTLIVLSGPPACGKSKLARVLAARHGFAHLEMDRFRLRLLPGSQSTRENRRVALRAMHLTAESLLRRRTTVILDASYRLAEDRQQAREAALAAGAAFALVEFTVPLEMALSRCRARRGRHPGDDLTDERVTELATRFPFTGEGLTVDGALPLRQRVAAVERYLGIRSNRPAGRR